MKNIYLNNEVISIRKFKTLFGEEATKAVKAELKNVVSQLSVNTEFGLVEVK